MLRLLLLVYLALNCFAADVVGSYIFYQEASLSGASQKVTIQQASSGTRDLVFNSVSLWCNVDATFTISRTGTAATATSGTVNRINTWQPTATASAYTSSDVGAGTSLRSYYFKGNSPELVLDLENFKILRNAGTTGNITVATNSVTGTCRISFLWDEEI